MYSRSKLVDHIVDSLQSGQSESQLAHQVAAYLIEAGKTSDLNSLMRDAQEQRAQKYGQVELTARSAHRLDDSHRDEIKRIASRQYPSLKKIQVNEEIDETVVGGANLDFPHASLDLTIRAKLNQLREAVS